MILRRSSRVFPEEQRSTPFRSWQEATTALTEAAAPATGEQLTLADKIGIGISPTTPRVVAAATLRVALEPVIGNQITSSPVERFGEHLASLRHDSDPAIDPANGEEASAWIEYLHLVRRREALGRLRLCEGDIVKTPNHEVAQVSSIGVDGRVYFKGGLGQSSWPDLVEVLARADDHTAAADSLRKRAADMAAHRRQRARFSAAKAAALSDYAVTDTPTIAEIDEFEQVVDGAEDERPIQRFLSDHQHMLACLLGDRLMYSVALPRLGSQYVPDFVIAGVDSLGIRWVLVELETPNTAMYLKDGKRFSGKTRNALSQIVDWRHWLSQNLSYARSPKDRQGLGLIDITPKPPAVVVIGRRSGLPAAGEAARHDSVERNIEVQTYDRLFERLRKLIQFTGPPGANPHLIPQSPCGSSRVLIRSIEMGEVVQRCRSLYPSCCSRRTPAVAGSRSYPGAVVALTRRRRSLTKGRHTTRILSTSNTSNKPSVARVYGHAGADGLGRLGRWPPARGRRGRCCRFAAGGAPAATPSEWLERRRADLLPTEYFHVVFAVPPLVARAAVEEEAVEQPLRRRRQARAPNPSATRWPRCPQSSRLPRRRQRRVAQRCTLRRQRTG